MSDSPVSPTSNEPAGRMDAKRLSTVLQTTVQTSNNTEHALTRMIRRLEAATSRLEDIASSSFDGSGTPGSKGAPATNGVSPTQGAGATGITAVAGSDTPTPTPSAPFAPPKKEDLPDSITDFDALLNGDLRAYHELSKAGSIDKLLGEQVCLTILHYALLALLTSYATV